MKLVKYIKRSAFILKNYGLKELIVIVYNRFYWFRKAYRNFMRTKEPKDSELDAQSREEFSYNPKYSVVIPLYKTEKLCLEELLQSFLNQTYKNVELCLADSSPDSDKTVLKEVCDKYVENGLSINYIPLEKNLGISGNTNVAIEAATGDFIIFCDHDDTVALDTLYECTKRLNADPTIDAFYSEQDFLSSDGKIRKDPIFKPDLDMEFLRNCNYITHIFVVRKTIIDAVGMLNPEMDGSQDYDFILRVCEYTKKVCHIPSVLYHWRLVATSTAANPEVKMYAYEAGKKAVASHLTKQGIDIEKVDYDMSIGRYHTTYVIKNNPLVSVVVNNPGKALFKALEVQDYKNTEIVNNVNEAKGDYLLFLDDYVVPENESFVRELLGFAQREDVGAVVPRIDFKNGYVYSMGKVLGVNGFMGDGLFNMHRESKEGLWWGHSVRTVSAAGFEALMTKRESYFSNIPKEEMGDFKDVDYCLSLRKCGKSIIANPYANGTYTGKNKIKDKSLGKDALLLKWENVFKEADPYYNIHFSSDRANYNL